MRLYHATRDEETAAAILAEGFKDGEGTYLTPNTYRGVWLSDQVLIAGDLGISGLEPYFWIEIPEEVVTPYEWVEEWPEAEERGIEKASIRREFLVPAEVVNHYGPPVRFDPWAEEDDE